MLRPRCPWPWSHRLHHGASGSDGNTEIPNFPGKALKSHSAFSSAPYEKCQRGSAMTIPSKIHGSGRGLGSQGWPELAEVGWTVVLSLAPAGPVLGRFILFLTSFPKVSTWRHSRIPLRLNLGAGQGFQEEQHHQSQLGGQIYPKSVFLCLPHVGFHSSSNAPSPQEPGMLWGSAASSCLIPLVWGSRVSGIEGNGTPQLDAVQGGF